MTELEISIGGRTFSVACDNEEQEKVKEAAALISEEADSIQNQLGRLPEPKMLLLSALMIADRLVEVESASKVLEERSAIVLDLKNKNKELEKHKSELQNDYHQLEKLVEKILSKLEVATDFSDNQASSLLDEGSSKQATEKDQPKLF